MTRFVRNRMIIFVGLAWLLYWPLALSVPQVVLIELINGVVASLSIGLAVAYAPGVWAMTRRRPYHMTGADMLVLGVTLVQISLAGLFAWAWLYRYQGGTAWAPDHIFRGSMVYLLMLGGIMHLMASDVGAVNGAVPDRGWMHLGLMIAVGLGLGVTVLSLGGP